MTRQVKQKQISSKQGQTLQQYAMLAYAGFVTIIVTAQLYSLDVMVKDFPLFSGKILLVSLVVSGVFSLPYILALQTGKVIQIFSFLCAAILPLLWLIFTITSRALAETGIMGTIVSNNMVGCGAVIVSVVGTFLAIRYRGVPAK